MDETGFFSKLRPSGSLATHRTSGSEDYIIITLNINADGSELE